MPLDGHLCLICAPDATGRSVLRQQSFSAPVHISKPHWDGEALLVNLVNPTAGLFAGDHITYDVTAEAGARLVLASPSAARAHAMAEGEARVEQHFKVALGARLEVWPELFIPQRGARYRQTTRVEVEAGGELLFFENIAPGRTASGEVFAFERLHWATDIFFEGRLAMRERFELTLSSHGVAAMRAVFPEAYYASAWIFSPRLDPQSPCWETARDLQSETLWIGVSRLDAGGWTLKVLAADSIALRHALTTLRTVIYQALGSKAPSLRRY
jgi:urease accessory protein